MKFHRLHFSSVTIRGIAMAALLGCECVVPAQTTRVTQGKDFSWPSYYSASNGVQRLKSLLTGGEIQLLSGLSVLLLKRPRLEFYRQDGTLEWTATSLDCIVNTAEGTVSGTNRLVVKTGNTNLFDTGVGFLWRRSDSMLIVSNQAFTWIDTTAMGKSPRKQIKALGASLLISTAALAADIEQPPPRAGLMITGQLQIINFELKTVYYSNNVLLVDPPAKPGGSNTILRCQQLTAKQNATGTIESIVAEGTVEIDQGDLRARADHAVYLAETDQITLTGQGSRPKMMSGQITSVADQIIYDRRTGVIRSDGNVETILPSGSLPRFNENPTNPPSAPAIKNSDPKKTQPQRR